ncbi:hypothetical protein MMC14_010432 [Varicellaria rhodocarpa]|nr:hypothetical protein [Varicellaria rhodocarpa]
MKAVTVLSTNIGIYRLKARVEIARIRTLKEAFTVIKLFKDCYQTSSVYALESIIRYTLGTLATDPRDKIYALLGLSCQSSWFEGICNCRKIIHDYSHSVTRVFTDATGAMLQSHATITIFSMAGLQRDRSLSTLPSWVPDYTIPHSFTPFSTSARFGAHAGYNVVDGAQTMIHLTDREQTVGLTGAKWDVIQEIGVTGRQVKSPRLSLSFTSRIRLITQLPTIYHTGQNRAEALWRTLIADHKNAEFPAPPSMKHAVRDCILWWLLIGVTDAMQVDPHNDIVRRRADPFDLAPLADLGPLAATDTTGAIPNMDDWKLYWKWWMELSGGGQKAVSDPLERAKPFLDALGGFATHRRLFRTGNNYLGLGAEQMQDGDSLWLLQGAKVPHILQETEGGRYILVGEAYIHGIMLRENLDLDRLTFQKIELE